MRCPHCGRRVGFNQRGNICPRCGAWLLRHQPSEHELEHIRRGPSRDDFLNDFPWVGGAPGKRAIAFTAIWTSLLVVLALATIASFITMHFVLAVVLIFVTALVGVLPKLFLVGSRI